LPTFNACVFFQICITVLVRRAHKQWKWVVYDWGKPEQYYDKKGGPEFLAHGGFVVGIWILESILHAGHVIWILRLLLQLRFLIGKTWAIDVHLRVRLIEYVRLWLINAWSGYVVLLPAPIILIRAVSPRRFTLMWEIFHWIGENLGMSTIPMRIIILFIAAFILAVSDIINKFFAAIGKLKRVHVLYFFISLPSFNVFTQGFTIGEIMSRLGQRTMWIFI
jgi:hypothetical protein